MVNEEIPLIDRRFAWRLILTGSVALGIGIALAFPHGVDLACALQGLEFFIDRAWRLGAWAIGGFLGAYLVRHALPRLTLLLAALGSFPLFYPASALVGAFPSPGEPAGVLMFAGSHFLIIGMAVLVGVTLGGIMVSEQNQEESA